jgi:hypothetical protein
MALERIGFKGKIFTLGTYFDSTKMAFQNQEGNYQAISKQFSFSFNGSKFRIPFLNSSISKTQLNNYQLKLKAKIQDYNYRMVNNKFY